MYLCSGCEGSFLDVNELIDHVSDTLKYSNPHWFADPSQAPEGMTNTLPERVAEAEEKAHFTVKLADTLDMTPEDLIRILDTF